MAPQTETTVRCGCKDPQVLMKLVEGLRKTRPEPRPVARFINEADLPPDDSPPPRPTHEPRPVETPATDPVGAASENTPTANPDGSSKNSGKKRRRRSRGARRDNPPAETGPNAGSAPMPSTSEPSPTPQPDDFASGIEGV